MKSKSRRLTAAACTLAMTAGMLAAAAWLWSQYSAQMADRLLHELQQSSESEVEERARRLASLGPVALPGLCEAMFSPRYDVAEAAQARIIAELARWQLLPPRKASRNLARLAELIELHAQREGRANSLVADVSARVLNWPAAGLPDMPQIAARCETVLRLTSPISPEPALLADVPVASPIEPPTPSESPIDLVVQETQSTAPSAQMNRRDAGATAPAAVDETTTTDAVAPPALASGAAEPPGLLPADVESARPLSQAGNDEPPANTIADQPNPQPVHSPVRTNQAEPTRALDRLNTVPLAQLLHSDDPRTAQAARAELLRRGHSASYIEMVQGLTDPNPAVRSRWASALPAMAEIDARSWLLWLSRDEDASVRFVAVGIMATAGELQMQRRLQEMAADEPDPRVRALAQRAASGNATPGR